MTYILGMRGKSIQTLLPKSRHRPQKQMADFLFDYHQSKMVFGLIIMAFEDAVKEGDGQRVYDLYKLLLLIYKYNKHPKYAYVTLHYLVRIAALLPEFDAERLKWNRVVNL